ncbi:MAG: glycosyltransferase family 39 protein [Microcoleus sp. SU_5_3]|nr:glycosyltransferase family 39 protein [Microcoleus sp. SU_5_3]
MNERKGFRVNFTISTVLLVGFLIRLAVPLGVFILTQDLKIFYGNDTGSFMQPAFQLIEHGKFFNNGQPELFRTPGYPLFLIPGMLLGHLEIVTIPMQIFLDCLTIYLIYKIALPLFKVENIATLCAFLYAIEPLAVLRSSILMSESVFTTLVTLFLYKLIVFFDSRSWKQLFFAAIALTASIYVRPIGYYLPFLITTILLIWSLKNRQKNKVLIVQIFVFFIVTMSSLGIWQIRNYITTGYSGFTAVSDYNLYCHNGASVIASKKKMPIKKVFEELGCNGREKYLTIHPKQQQWSQAQIYRYMGQEGKMMMMNHPFTYSIYHLEGMLATLIETPGKRYLTLFSSSFGGSVSLVQRIPKILTGTANFTEVIELAKKNSYTLGY